MAWGRALSRVCLSVCPRYKRKTKSVDKKTKHIVGLHVKTSACTGPELKRSDPNPNPRVRVLTFAMGMGRDLPGVGLHVNTTVHFSSYQGDGCPC